jgi:hypothetical protein
MRVPAHVLEEARMALEERNKRATTGIWPEHWHAVTVLTTMATQWLVVAGMGGIAWTGMDYSSLPTVIEATKSSMPRRLRKRLAELLPQLQVMERVVLRIRNG